MAVTSCGPPSHPITFDSPSEFCALASALFRVLREFQQWLSRFADPLPTQERLVLRSSFAPYLVVSVGFRPRSRRVRRDDKPSRHATVKSHLMSRKAAERKEMPYEHRKKPLDFPPAVKPCMRLSPHTAWQRRQLLYMRNWQFICLRCI